MTHQLMLSAKKKGRKLDGQNRLPEIIQGLNSVTVSSTKSKPPDHVVTNFRA
jgi:hypothetical protein